MKITETNTAPEIKLSPLQKFSERKFNLELSGFDLLALYAVSQRIAGTGSVRGVFSCSKNGSSFCSIIDQIEGAEELLEEFEVEHNVVKNIHFVR